MNEFCEVAAQVVKELPEPFHHFLENTVVDVKERPSPRTLSKLGLGPHQWDELMGLFEGLPVTEQHFGEHHPNRITLYKQSIERASRSVDEIKREIRRTILHELAHHFGYSEEDLDEFESAPNPFDKN